MSSNSRQQLEDWLKTIDVEADRVLDIGGAQNPVKGRTKSWKVKEYKILDLENPHKIQQKPDIIADISKHDMYDWSIVKKIIKGFTNQPGAVFCLEVMEYVVNPLSALINIHEALSDDGILYISFHHIYPIHKPSGLDYLRYTEHGVRKLLEKTGFKILEFEYRNFSPDGANAYGNLIGVEGMRPDKDYNKHYTQGYLVKAQKQLYTKDTIKNLL